MTKRRRRTGLGMKQENRNSSLYSPTAFLCLPFSRSRFQGFKCQVSSDYRAREGP